MSKQHKNKEKTIRRYQCSATTVHINASSKVLVTGGAGFFGSHICEKLLLDGKQVIVVDMLNNETSSRAQKIKYIEHLNELSKAKEGAQFRMYELDILQEHLVSEVLKAEAPTNCIHAAALVRDRKSVEEPIRYIINNVQGTQSLLNAIRQTDTIRRLVLISSRSAVGETPTVKDKMTEDDLLRPINPYGATKAAAEALCHAFYKNFGLSVAICRMEPLYGPRCRNDMMPNLLFESAIHDKVVPKFGSGSAVRDWLYVEDAALGILAALNDSERFSIFNFGTGIGTTLNELIQMVMEITGKRLSLIEENIPPGDAVFAGVCDSQKAKKTLGWEAKIDLKTGLKLTYEYMKKNKDINDWAYTKTGLNDISQGNLPMPVNMSAPFW
jgi:nucleoside-diphosphate-sugar epimerase